MTHFFRFYNRPATPLWPAVTLGAGAAIMAVIITCLTAATGVQPATAQDGNIPTTLRSSSLFVRGGLHNGNRVKTRFVNTGLIGGNANPPTCAWPTENNPYLYDAGVIFGVEKVFRDTILYPITSAFPNGDTTSATGTRLRDNVPNKSTRAGARGVSGGVQEFLGNVLVGGNYGASVAMPEKYTTTHLGPRGAGYKTVNGAFSGLQPVPGFFNNSGNNQSLAMSHLPNSWPAEWPDHPDWKNAATGKANWNGYFGRDVFNADQESYLVTDDANDRTFEAEYKYRPIPAEPDRAGLGLQVKVRGLQWANFLAQDNVFWVYEVKNVSKFDYDKVVFASIAGTAVANTFQNISLFDQSRQITYTYNPPNIPPSQPWNNLYTPGYVGLAFLESPGNPFDGIDNDDSYGEEADPITGPRFNPYGNLITRESVVVPGNAAATGSDALAFIGGEIPDQFRKSGGGTNPAFTNTGYEFDEVKGEPVPRVLKANDWLITIGQKSIPPPGGRYPAGVTIAVYERSALQLPASGSLTLTSLGKIYTVKVGDTLREAPQNNFDDNLNGVVDETYRLHYRRLRTTVNLAAATQDSIVLAPLRFVNYIRLASQGRSLNNSALYPLLDERRDDGLDNNRDWDSRLDDVGADGKLSTTDAGEGDQQLTPGEPRFDALDIRESDQIGLTSYVARNETVFQLGNYETIWNLITPGLFDPFKNVPDLVDYMYGTGYFPLKSGQSERFSLSLVYGQNVQEVLNNQSIVQQIYDNNYNFTSPPKPEPKVTAYTGDVNGKPYVTLTWTADGEDFFDAFIARKAGLTDPANADALARTFEGYRVYRGTDKEFTDAFSISDGFGNQRQFKQPVAQFDKVDGISGFSKLSFKGVQYNLGSETGLQHSWTDSTVVAGRQYFYGVVNYAKENEALGFFPAENGVLTSPDGRGGFSLPANVVVITAKPSAAGTVNPNSATGGLTATSTNKGQGGVDYTLLVPGRITQDRTLEVSFTGTDSDTTDNNGNAQKDEFLEELEAKPSYFSVKDVATGQVFLSRSKRYLGEPSLYVDGRYRADEESKVVDSLGLFFDVRSRTATAPDTNNTRWNLPASNDTIPTTIFAPMGRQSIIDGLDAQGPIVARPSDYAVVILAGNTGRSDSATIRFLFQGVPQTTLVTPQTTNYKVVNLTTGQEVRYVLSDVLNATLVPGNEVGIIFLEQSTKGNRPAIDSIFSWRVQLNSKQSKDYPVKAGDTLYLRTFKPILDGDKFTISLRATTQSESVQKEALTKIRAVPNPYVVTNAAEPTFGGQGQNPRKMFFTNMPYKATLRIYTIRGELIRTLTNEDAATSQLGWDMRTAENLDIAYGVYLYHVDAPGLGTTTGKFAVIK